MVPLARYLERAGGVLCGSGIQVRIGDSYSTSRSIYTGIRKCLGCYFDPHVSFRWF